MMQMAKMLDYTIDYEKNIQEQIKGLETVEASGEFRFTIIDINGVVQGDNDVGLVHTMENHKDREEFIEAVNKGSGEAVRLSSTLDKSMLYISYRSSNELYIIRVAVPFSGMIEYMSYLLPAVIISFGIALMISFFILGKFSESITMPLQEISEQLLKLNEENPKFEFKNYQYDEMNSIAETTKRMVEAVQISKKQIDFERLVRQEFFSNVSHELKTPITSIQGYAELLNNDMDFNGTMKKEFLARIMKETENMTNLINDILMISRLETKEVEVNLEEVRLYPLINEVCTSLEPLAIKCQVNVYINCKPLSMYANPGQLKELFSNLITNAIKYNKPGGRVKVKVSLENKDVVIVIEDTGVGIPEESKARVFERFYRVDKGRSKKMGGTGLGLSIVKHVVNYYNGSIHLESVVGEGSKFTIYLPQNVTNH